MARVELAITAPTDIASDGTNITDLVPKQMVPGTDNGEIIIYRSGDVILFRNDTGGPAVFTLISPENSALIDLGGGVVDPVINVADGKDHIIPPLSTLDQGGVNKGKIFIDCDVAGRIAAIRLSAQQ